MKRILYLIVDLLIIYGSIVFIFYLFEHLTYFLEDFRRNFDAFVEIIPFIGAIYLILMYVFGIYSSLYKSVTELVYTVFLTSVALIVCIMGICFLIRDVAFAFPRSVIFLSGLLYFTFLTLWRVSLWYILRKKHGIKKITIIGDVNERLSKAILSHYSSLYQIENQFLEIDPLLPSKIKSVDVVFMSSDVSQALREKVLPLCLKYEKEVFFVPKYFDLSIISSSFIKTDDIPTFSISGMSLSPEDQFVKRAGDLLIGTIATIVIFPLSFILALLIKLDGGPVLYTQERLTKGNRIFKIYKFRTMIPDAEKVSGPVLANENDPRITKLGKFMRAVRLDEIPQLINILKGEMSIVGPRPERPFFVEQFEKEIPEYRYRYKVKAGLTGLAQVEGKYNTTVEDKLRYDLIYINNFSVLRDFMIMLQTIKILFMKSSTEGVNSN
jgi:exopolysaccharide biosynthesis polyprenyl glycosylphosphotransferase